MVAIALRAEGVVDTQLASPGLGECTMVFAQRNVVQR